MRESFPLLISTESTKYNLICELISPGVSLAYSKQVLTDGPIQQVQIRTLLQSLILFLQEIIWEHIYFQ